MKGKVTNRFENHTILKKKKKNRPNNYSLQEKVCKEKQRAREPILTPVEINLFEVFHVNLLSE